jgi:hypothetical protein
MTRDRARDLAASILRDVFPQDALHAPRPVSPDPAEALREALWRDAGVNVNAETARDLHRAGWSAP